MATARDPSRWTATSNRSANCAASSSESARLAVECFDLLGDGEVFVGDGLVGCEVQAASDDLVMSFQVAKRAPSTRGSQGEYYARLHTGKHTGHA
jgi:hypothetical protein